MSVRPSARPSRPAEGTPAPFTHPPKRSPRMDLAHPVGHSFEVRAGRAPQPWLGPAAPTYHRGVQSQILMVRRFNRMITQRTGALNDRFLSRDRPLASSRLLWEIGTEGADVQSLRSRMGIDEQQIHTRLKELRDAAMVTLTPDPAGHRSDLVHLTSLGLTERALLNRRSDDFAADLLGALSESERTELVTAMRTVERLLTRAQIEFRQADPTTPEARSALRAYVAELNSRAPTRGFDPAKGSTAEPHEVQPPHGAFVLVYLNGEPVGCGAIKHQSATVTDIKRMWLADSARGLGIGRLLLAHLEELARARGSREAHLETSEVLPEAIALYLSSGYSEVPAFNDEPFADHWYLKTLD